MKKTVKLGFFFLLILSIFVVSLTGCGEKEVEIKLDELSAELLDSGAFTDLMSPVPAETAASLYHISGESLADCVLYCGTGATAEEIALFRAASESAVADLKAAVDTRIQNQLTAYESYVPEEVPKLEDALVEQIGNYVFCVVSGNTDAIQTILDKYNG